MTELLFEPGADRAEEHTRTTKGEEHELMNSQIQSMTERQKQYLHIPEALLSENGRKLLNSETFPKNVVACVIDEAHALRCGMWSKLIIIF